jgi:hypothetical protein
LNDDDHLPDQIQALFSAADVDALSQAVYPIEDLDQLAVVVGVQAVLSVRDREVAAKDAAALIPAYYFPISNAADFKSKLADLAELGALNEQELYEEWAKRANPELPPAITDCWS